MKNVPSMTGIARAAGLISINFCGAVVLLIWLITTPLNIPLRGSVILWSIAIIVLGVGLVEIFAKSWIYKEPEKNLRREDLLKLTQVYAKNWLAHDGCWFLAAEEKFGMETAMELDAKSWERFAVVEARRIMKEFEITSNGGLKALEKALQFRLYAAINRQEIEWVNDNKIIFRMLECRVQKTRRQKNLPDFPCKSVGLVEFSHFVKTVDPRIQTKCIACPPDPVTDFYCGWEFTIDE